MSGGRDVVVRGGYKLTPPQPACIVYSLTCLLLHGVYLLLKGRYRCAL